MKLISSLSRLKEALKKTKEKLSSGIISIIRGKGAFTNELVEELEYALISADVNINIVEEIIRKLGQKHYKNENEIIEELRTILLSYLDDPGNLFNLEEKPYVILVVGVNGTGKTTSIAKLAHLFKMMNKRVILGAADTFRAASQEQLAIWAERLGVPLVGAKMGADPASVAFDTVSKAIAKDFDIVIIDTAGRIHTKRNLMEELRKIVRVVSKLVPSAPHETLLVLDATTGQNAISQAKEFNEATKLTGIILTKLDTSAKGGSIFGIKRELNIPIKFVGTGETVDDLAPFDPYVFVDDILDYKVNPMSPL